MNADMEQIKQEGLQKFARNQYQAAAECFRVCVETLEKEGTSLESAEMRNNWGVTLIRLKQFESALSALQGTEQTFAAAEEVQKEGMAFANLGNALEGLKRYEEALQAYEKAKECFKSSGEQKMLSVILKYISDLQMKTGKQFQALASLQSSYQENPDADIKSNFFKRSIDFMIKKVTGR